MFSLRLICLVLLAAEALCTRYYSFRTPCSSGVTLGSLGECIQREANLPGPAISMEPLDPLPLDDFVVRAGNFAITNKNIVIEGFRNTIVNDVVWDMSDNTGHMELLSNATITCDYELDGKLFYIPVKTSGRMSVDIENAKIRNRFQFRKVEDDSGVDHVQSYDFSSVQSFGKFKFRITSSAVGGILDNTLSYALNQNWQSLVPDAPSHIADSIGKQMIEAINKIYYQVPSEDILQPIKLSI